MNHESSVEREKRLSKLHNVNVGETVILHQIRSEAGGLCKSKKITKTKVKVIIQNLYDHYVRVRLPWGYSESYKWLDFDHMRRGGSCQRETNT